MRRPEQEYRKPLNATLAAPYPCQPYITPPVLWIDVQTLGPKQLGSALPCPMPRPMGRVRIVPFNVL